MANGLLTLNHMKKATLHVKIPVSIFKEGKYFVAYSPVLDLSTCGDTKAEAKKMFDEAVEVFFEELIKEGTLKEVLKDLGWQEEKATLKPPALISQELRKICVPANL